MSGRKSKLEQIFDSHKPHAGALSLTPDVAFRALQSIFGEDLLKRAMFDRFNKKTEISVHDLAILLIQLDTFFEVCPLEDLGLESPKHEHRGRSVLRAVSSSIKRMVSKNRDSKPNSPRKPAPRPPGANVDLSSFIQPPKLDFESKDPTPDIPPPRTPEEPPTADPRDIIPRLEKLEAAMATLQKSM